MPGSLSAHNLTLSGHLRCKRTGLERSSSCERRQPLAGPRAWAQGVGRAAFPGGTRGRNAGRGL